jgi:hypothetical protein
MLNFACGGGLVFNSSNFLVEISASWLSEHPLFLSITANPYVAVVRYGDDRIDLAFRFVVQPRASYYRSLSTFQRREASPS